MKKRSGSMVVLAAEAAGEWCAASVLLCLLLGLLTSKEIIPPQGAEAAGIMCSELLLMLFCALCAGKCGRRKLPAALLAAGMVMALRAGVGILITRGGTWSQGWRFLIPVAAAVAGGCIAGRKRERKR